MLAVRTLLPGKSIKIAAPGIWLRIYSYEIISAEFFTVLILTTMLSSLIAGYWLRYQQKKDDTIFMELTKNS